MSRLPVRAEARNLGALRRLYTAPEWALLTQVRNDTGVCETLRIADAVAVRLWPGDWRIHGFELKVSRRDWMHELKHPEKSGPLKMFCSAWYLVTPAPWKRVLLSTRELPDRWGLIELGTGAPHIVVAAPERQAEAPEPGFIRSLLRSADRDVDEEPDDAPRVLITRLALSRTHVGLACGHVALRPLAKAKVMPRSLPCHACKDGRASDRAFIEAALEDASLEDLAAYADLIERRAPRRAAA